MNLLTSNHAAGAASVRFGAYLDAALDAVVVADASGCVVEFNPAAERMFGYSREEVLGRTLAELIVPPSLRERHARAFARFIQTGEARVLGRRIELTGMRADGSEFPVELALSRTEGEPLLICGAIRDLSDAKRAADDLRKLADEQAALRRVATLVADEAAPDVIFASVAEEIARMLMADRCAIGRFETDDSMTVVAYWTNEEPNVPVGTRIGLQGDGVTAAVRESRRPILIDDHEAFSGALVDYARTLGSLPRSTVAAPIFVESRVWGSIFASTMAVEIAEGTESRVVDFAELIATAIANTEARRELERVATEQRALRKAALLVASGASPSEVFAAITTSAADLFEVPFASLLRYEPDERATMIAGSAACSGFVGRTWTVPGDDPGVVRTVVGSRRPARIEDHSGVHGPLGEVARSLGIGSIVGVPVVVGGSVWGVLAVGAVRDGPPLPVDASDRLVGFTELVTTTLINAETRDSLHRLADEQAGLRRVATHAARQSSPVEVFEAVAEEAARVLEVDAIGMLRFDPDGTATLVAQSEAPWDPPPLGTCFTLEGENIVASVHRTGQAARMDDWESATGSVAAMASVLGVRSAVASPIVVEGQLWGTMVAATNRSKPLPADTEARIVNFTELLATAIANADSRAELAASEARARELAHEQAALRRVATLVAQAPASEELFSAVAHEVATVLNVPGVIVTRYEADGMAVVFGDAFESELSGAEAFFGVGSRAPADPGSLAAQVLETHGTARVDDFSTLVGTVGDLACAAGFSSGCAAPIVVNGELWGKMCVFSGTGTVLPARTEERLDDFIELVATAISNYEARAELAASEARALELANEQAALRRVATLVAEGAAPQDVFDAVRREVAGVFDAPFTVLWRFDPDGIVTVLASDRDYLGASGGRWPIEDDTSIAARVRQTGRAVRVDLTAPGHAPGSVAEAAERAGVYSGVGVPIVVEGELWGAMNVGSEKAEPLPAGLERRLERFTELLATAIANAESREELAQLAAEQAALRQVATLVAQGAEPGQVFAVVAEEVAGIINAPIVAVFRYESDGTCTTLGVAGETSLAGGSRSPVEEEGISGRILASGRPARTDDYSTMGGLVGEAVRETRIVATVGVPIVVEGSIWGFMVAGATPDRPIPTDTEERLARFTELVATAVSNATMRGELVASRARVIAAGDDARRRIERDLHDGAQQQLVTLALAMRSTEGRIPTGQEQLKAEVGGFADRVTSVVEELREMSRGIHPAILSEGGLSPALEALALRSAVPVTLNVRHEQRLPDAVEVAAYYVASEALTNASKHADASRVELDLHLDDASLRLSIRDDGRGGADPSRGSGLLGLKDRVEALGGTIDVESPHGTGTRLRVAIPVRAESSAG